MCTAYHMLANIRPGKPLKALILAAFSAIFGKGILDSENTSSVLEASMEVARIDCLKSMRLTKQCLCQEPEDGSVLGNACV